MSLKEILILLLGFVLNLLVMALPAFSFLWRMSLFVTITCIVIVFFWRRIKLIEKEVIVLFVVILVLTSGTIIALGRQEERDENIKKCKRNHIVRFHDKPTLYDLNSINLTLGNTEKSNLVSPSVYLFHVPLGEENLKKYGVICKKATLHSDLVTTQQYRFEIPYSRLEEIRASFLMAFVQNKNLPCGFSADVIYTADSGKRWHPRFGNDIWLDQGKPIEQRAESFQMDSFVSDIQDLAIRYSGKKYDACKKFKV